MLKLTIIGASGHGKVVADIARKNGYNDIVFLDDDINIRECGRYPVVGKTELAKDLDGDFFVGIGNADIRKGFMEKLSQKNIITLIHPDAVVADDVDIGKGTVVMAGSVINSGTIIGDGVIINTCSSVDHDCVISNYVHVSVGAHICGTVLIKEMTWIGAGCTVINNLYICEGCMVGAGSVVVNDIKIKGTYYGLPAVIK